jgi:serine/threonine-protein kinase
MPAQEQDRRDETILGARIGQYRVVEEIGRGGMGVVYRVVHEEIGRVAAVKILSGARAASPAAARRFVNEARAVSRVDHPGVAKIFDFGETDGGVPYILMELLQGELLRARLDRLRAQGQALAPVAAARFARQIAAALAAAHALGIVHRDLKPENVMVVADDEAPGGERIKLLDFGIARFLAEEAGHTAPGAVVGTALYMAPEQCAGTSEIDGRADVYALGIVLYEMLAGAPPFRGDFATLLRRHLVEEPRPLALACPGLPVEVARLVHRMLAKEPSLRPDMAATVELIRGREASLPDTAGAITEEQEVPVHALPTRSGEPARAGAETVPDPGATVPDARPTVPESPTAPGPPPAAQAAAPVSPWRLRRGAALLLLLLLPLGVLAPRWLAARARRAPPVVLTDMAWIPGATFRMGSTPAEIDAECARTGAECRRDLLEREQPLREVTVTGFHLDAHEARNDELAAWLQAIGPSLDVRDDRDEHWPRFVFERARGILLVDLYPARSGVLRTPEGRFQARPGHERRPAVQVTWDAASLYCQARGKRLPTEAEWELAARGPARRVFPWGDAPPRCEGVVLARDKGDPCAGQPEGVQDVGTAPQDRTPEGVFDLGGNASEWIQDPFLLPYYPPCGACVDPLEDPPGPRPEDLRIKRGGSWGALDILARGATRGRWKRSSVLDGLGFRCASR